MGVGLKIEGFPCPTEAATRQGTTLQKMRGGYYTPIDLACFLVEWVKEIRPKRVLEPSVGDGRFLEAFGRVGGFDAVDIVGCEIDRDEMVKSQQKTKSAKLGGAKIYRTDFLQWFLENETSQPFDAVVGNPPFIRYQSVAESFQKNSQKLFESLGIPFTKHANAWIPFVVASIRLLRDGGRLGMVVPSEILHVSYARPLRSFLRKACKKIVIVDPVTLWFDDALQGTVLLMCEKKADQELLCGVGIHVVRDREFLQDSPNRIFNNIELADVAPDEKWTIALLDKKTRTLIQRLKTHPNIKKFEDVAKVDVGIVTGANDFFLAPNSVIEKYQFQKWSRPILDKGHHCWGIIYDRPKHDQNIKDGYPVYFLAFPKDGKDLDENALSYILSGETKGLHLRYKCRIRKPWYVVPSVYSTAIALPKHAHHAHRMILNAVGAYTTDSMYRISVKEIPAEKLVYCYLNPLTALTAEIEGRYYGGGVLELVPSEIEKLLIPLPDIDIDLKVLNEKFQNENIMEILESQGDKLLMDGGFGLDKKDVVAIFDSWIKLKNHRQRI